MCLLFNELITSNIVVYVRHMYMNEEVVGQAIYVYVDRIFEAISNNKKKTKGWPV